MYHLWRVPNLAVAARKLPSAGSHPAGGVIVPYDGREFMIANEGSYLPGMKRTWIVSERVRRGVYRPRNSFVTFPETRITPELLERGISEVEWPDAEPIEVDAEEYPAKTEAA